MRKTDGADDSRAGCGTSAPSAAEGRDLTVEQSFGSRVPCSHAEQGKVCSPPLPACDEGWLVNVSLQLSQCSLSCIAT